MPNFANSNFIINFAVFLLLWNSGVFLSLYELMEQGLVWLCNHEIFVNFFVNLDLSVMIYYVLVIQWRWIDAISFVNFYLYSYFINRYNNTFSIHIIWWNKKLTLPSNYTIKNTMSVGLCMHLSVYFLVCTKVCINWFRLFFGVFCWFWLTRFSNSNEKLWFSNFIDPSLKTNIISSKLSSWSVFVWNKYEKQ